MLFGPVHLHRPDLRPDVDAARLLLGGPTPAAIALPALVRLFGIRVSPGFREALEARGALHLEGASFHNDGPPILRTVRVRGLELRLSVGERLRGRVVRAGEHVALWFDGDATVVLSRFGLRISAHALELRPDAVDVRVRGGADVHLDLRAAGSPSGGEPG
jgi:hypothetical protein